MIHDTLRIMKGKGTRERMETINENNEQERTKNKNDNKKG
jgi:hypothetical protein